MMGATFPALVKHVARNAALSDAFGRLYSANTIGAVIGTLVAGLVLVELLGLSERCSSARPAPGSPG